MTHLQTGSLIQERNGGKLDDLKGLPKGLPMPTIATKLPAEVAKQVRCAAEAGKTTVSAYLRKAVENEVAGRQTETFGTRFGHLFGAARRLPANASRKEAYED
jgi:hypothetical protein